MALSVWLDKWLDEYMAATLRPTTLNGYRRSLELYVKPYLGNKTLSKITAVDCSDGKAGGLSISGMYPPGFLQGAVERPQVDGSDF